MRWFGPVTPVGDSFAIVHSTYFGKGDFYEYNWRNSTWETRWSALDIERNTVFPVAVSTRTIGC